MRKELLDCLASRLNEGAFDRLLEDLLGMAQPVSNEELESALNHAVLTERIAEDCVRKALRRLSESSPVPPSLARLRQAAARVSDGERNAAMAELAELRSRRALLEGELREAEGETA